jgi:hypothetical protein
MTSGYLFSLLLPFAFIAYAGYRYWVQSSADETDQSLSWAMRRGLIPGEPPQIGSTPMLRLSDGQAHDCWEVPIGDGSGTLYRWTWTLADDRSATAREMNLQIGLRLGEVTVVQAMLAAGFPHFRVVPRHGFVAPSGGWDEQEVQLESVEFGQQFKLLAGSDGDHQALLRLFDPETIVWSIGQGDLTPVIEYQLGTLVVSSRYACSSDVEYDSLLEHAQRIAKRVLAEGLLHQPDAAAGAG